MGHSRRRAFTTGLALFSVGALTGGVILATSLDNSGLTAGAAPDRSRCVTAAFPGETEPLAPSPSAPATPRLPVATPSPTASIPAKAIPPGWSGVWSTSVQDLDGPDLSGRTLRQVVLPSAGGTGFRIRLANTFGTEPLRLSRVSAALAAASGSPDLRGGTARRVTFEGAGEVEIQPGERVVSDPVDLTFGFGQSLAVDLVPQGPAVAGSGHSRSIATSYIGEGDLAGQTSGAAFSGSVRSWFWLEGIDVPDLAGVGAVSTFGDSITEGMSSTVDRNQRWPDLLAGRLRADPSTGGLGVLNEGIGGNRVASENLSCNSPSASGLRRFDHDVLSRPDVRVVVLALGINDIGSGTPATTVIDGLTVLAERAREHGLRVAAVTLTPFTCDDGCLTAEKEQQRKLVNDWIRSTDVFDAVADFDAAVRDPAAPERMGALYDSGDNLHPSDAGMQALAASFDLDALLGR
ncbi:SGNH/GDSL hydrolase family protein [Kineosporia rhizophila]|uniref:SGNH/GDSL hydrolase family protein n=1 Tax=Kineosporia rhizophila TaxID=84633 RepID=UPI001E4E905A|nr:SGNH/GDSL hydrolase family protein [Kineosporia rhizophila]